MRLKTYQAPTLKEALELVRKDLGPDAIIISNQQTATGFNLTAAIENNAVVLPNVPAEALKVQTSSQTPAHYSALQIMELFCECLEYHIVPEKIMQTLLNRLKTLIDTASVHQIDQVVEKLLPHAPLNFKEQIVLLNEGPSGAGKSMTTAKLACEYMMAGQIPLIITMDKGKAGAVEQLQTYTKALKLPLYAFDTYKELISFVQAQSNQKVIIIDTPGINPLHYSDIEMRQDLALSLNMVPLLIYPAGTDPYELLDYLNSYDQIGAKKLILTKCDTTYRFTTLLTAVMHNSIQLSHISRGPELGSRLRPVTTRILLDLLTVFSQNAHYIKNRQKRMQEVKP